ncbi:MAG: deoxyribodipyrimidine photo-lyase [Candidatus Eisenbacteria bacterium]|nr:deoxyribodipyrimidine photo-lyase [Candidatus Eisenbacteria bacterium]
MNGKRADRPDKEGAGLENSPSIVWFRRDLRVRDNRALAAAAARGGTVLPVFIWAPEEEGKWAPGEASRWWLHHSLESLGRSLRSLGAPLVLRRGPSREALLDLAGETGAGAVYWNRLYDPGPAKRDRSIARSLTAAGILAEGFPGALLFEPEDVRSGSGGPYRVFTPFWNRLLSLPERGAGPDAPNRMIASEKKPRSLPLADLGLLPRVDWAAGLREAWTPGEEGAVARLDRFLREGIGGYDAERNRPDREGTSRLSPHLCWGEIAPSRAWSEARRRASRLRSEKTRASALAWLRQLAWREFAAHLLHHYPSTVEHPLREEFRRFPWRRSRKDLEAWREGRTGYPIVDAGMRQLRATGWMHNRVRMIAGSFLVKDLRLHWLEGARWFWDTLVDADLANNTLGWQWVAGCGADAAPYFRVFNPVAQGERYDPEGAYVKRHVPELAGLPAKSIHRAGEAPAEAPAATGLQAGRDYPPPMVDHARAREEALLALAAMKGVKKRNRR